MPLKKAAGQRGRTAIQSSDDTTDNTVNLNKSKAENQIPEDEMLVNQQSENNSSDNDFTDETISKTKLLVGKKGIKGKIQKKDIGQQSENGLAENFSKFVDNKTSNSKRGKKRVNTEENAEVSRAQKIHEKPEIDLNEDAANVDNKANSAKAEGKSNGEKVLLKPVNIMAKRGRTANDKAEAVIADDEDKPTPETGRQGRKKANDQAELADKDRPAEIGRRGRKKANDQPEELADKDRPAEIGRRGRKKANDQAEELADKDRPAGTGRRGRKKANDQAEELADKDRPAETGRRGRKKVNDQTEVPSVPDKNERSTPDSVKTNKNIKQNITKNEKQNTGKEKVLRVTVERDESIDKLAAGDTKMSAEVVKGEKGGGDNKKSNKRARADDSNAAANKPAKVPKKGTESKGQSKNDKMPDVTLLDFSNSSTAAGKLWNLKLSSWNVNGIRAWLEKDGLEYIKHESPDIMCFQETKCSKEKLPEEVNVVGYHSYWLAGDQEGYSGVGLISKTEPISVKYGIGIEEHDKEGRVINAEYENFFLINAYVPNAGKKLVRLDYRMQWDKDFRLYLKKLDEKKPIILCGDLNVAHEEIDLANPKTNKKNAGFTKEEREGFSTLLNEGFIDSFRHLYPDEKAYTFWTYMMNARAKNVGWRLDYFVISKKLISQLCDNVIRKDVMGSDHCPITLFLSV